MFDINIIPDWIEPLDREWLLKRAQENYSHIPESTLDGVPESFPIIHSTTTKRALKILESGKLLSYKRLEKESNSSVSSSLMNNTDELDTFLWLDEYVFTSLWKVSLDFLENPEDRVFFCYDLEDILDVDWIIASIKEIAELWATVSKIGANYHMRYEWISEEDIREDNRQAIENFYFNILTSKWIKRFSHDFFLRFPSFPTRTTYPWEAEEFEMRPEWKTLVNYWQWFQFMIPDELPLDKLSSIVCTTDNQYKTLSRKLKIPRIRSNIETDNNILFSLNRVKNNVALALNKKPNPQAFDIVIINLILKLIHNRVLTQEQIVEYFWEK